MAELTYSQALASIRDIKADFQSDTNIQAVKEYASTRSATYSSLMQQDSFTALDQSIRSGFEAVFQPVKEAGQRILDTANYALGNPLSTIDKAIGMPSQPAEDLEEIIKSKIQADITGGDTSMSVYLRESAEQMTAANQTDIDYNILSHLAYASKWNKDPKYQEKIQHEGITIKEYCESLLENWDDSSPDATLTDKTFLQQLAGSERYAGLTIDHSIGRTDKGNGEHTQVLVIGCGEGHAVMAIQGTDGTVKDWQNNGKFAGAEISEEETWVSSVTNLYANEYSSIDITGHSQGGREAVTAGIMMDSDNQKKIQRIVSNDGPGYSKSFMLRHADKIAEIQNRVCNIRPTNSYVGRILSPIGEIKYVRVINVVEKYEDGKPVYINSHLGSTWLIDSNGNYVWGNEQKIISVGALTELTIPFVEFVSTYMPEDRVNYYVDKIIALMSDDDGNIDFGKLTESSESWNSFLTILSEGTEEFKTYIDKLNQEQLTDFEYQMLVVSTAISDFFGEVSMCLLAVEGGLLLMSIAFPELLAVVAAIEGFRRIVSLIKNTALFVEVLFNAIAYFRERDEREARDNYIRDNGTLKVNADELENAARTLWSAGSAIFRALEAFSEMKGHFKGRFRYAIINALGLEEWLEDIEYVSRWDANGYCLAHGITGLSDSDVAKIDKAKGSIYEVANNARNALSSLGYAGDSLFDVNPGILKKYSGEGMALGNGIAIDQVGKLQETDNSLTTSWIGEDSNAHKTRCEQSADALKEIVTSLGNMFSLLSSVSDAYLHFQEDAIKTFQRIKL